MCCRATICVRLDKPGAEKQMSLELQNPDAQRDPPHAHFMLTGDRDQQGQRVGPIKKEPRSSCTLETHEGSPQLLQGSVATNGSHFKTCQPHHGPHKNRDLCVLRSLHTQEVVSKR